MIINELWKNKKAIIEGIVNNTFKKEHVEIIYNQRVLICKQCPKRDDFGSTCLIKGTHPCCSECGCSLKLKLRSLSSACPIGSWDALMTEEDKINNILKD